jgi:hypothetical protein
MPSCNASARGVASFLANRHLDRGLSLFRLSSCPNWNSTQPWALSQFEIPISHEIDARASRSAESAVSVIVLHGLRGAQ